MTLSGIVAGNVSLLLGPDPEVAHGFVPSLLPPVSERGDHEEGEHDERHALQEPSHQTVPHAEERGGQPTTGGGHTGPQAPSAALAESFHEAHSILVHVGKSPL